MKQFIHRFYFSKHRINMTISDVSSDKLQTGKIFKGPGSLDLSETIKGHKSLGHYLIDRIETESGDNVVFTDFNSGREWTGWQLLDKILNIGHALVAKYHLKPGTAVCVSYDNTDITHILSIGLICAGAVVACSYPKDPYTELLYLAKKVRPKLLFCHAKNLVKWRQQLSQDLGYDLIAISMDSDDSGGDLDTVDSLLDYDRNNSNAIIPVPMNNLERQVALITMSSGTTGQPKCVPVTHYNCISELVQTLQSPNVSRIKGQNFACCSSLDYVSGRIIVFGAINSGYNAVILDGFEPESFVKAVVQFRISVIYIGAASFYNFISWPQLDNYDLSSVRMVFPMGAKVIYLKELREFLAKHPNILLVRQGFGASEFGGAAMNALSPEKYLEDSENCGRLFPGVSAKIVDPETGNLLGPNQVGIVHIKSDTLFPGYYDRSHEKATKAEVNFNTELASDSDSYFVWDSTVFDQDFFYISGDLGYFNDKEELFIIGRQKELMSCRGAKKVLPQELEEILDKHPAVWKNCVLGIPSKTTLLQHCPRAFVAPRREYLNEPKLIDQLRDSRPRVAVLNEDLEREMQALNLKKQLTHLGNENTKLSSLPKEWRRRLAEDLMEFMNERVGWEKQLTGGIVILDEIPSSRTGKINKNHLRSLTMDEIELYGDQSN